MSQPEPPAISILMPAYNAAPFVAEAVASLLAQSYPHWELIVVDDASTDSTRDEIRKFSDPRIRIVERPTNQGLIAVLNLGLSLCRGTWIARMDADDICHPERLAKQMAFVNEHTDIQVLGTGVRFFRNNTEGARVWSQELIHPDSQDGIVAQMIFHSSVAHATVLMKRSLVDRYNPLYNVEFPHAEDYELWTRMLQDGVKIHNLQEALYEVRHHEASVSQRARPVQIDTARRVRALWRKRLQLDSEGQNAETHYAVGQRLYPRKSNALKLIEKCLVEIQRANARFKLCSQPALNRVIAETWEGACSALSDKGLSTWRHYRQSEFAGTDAMKSLRLLARCLIRPWFPKSSRSI